MTLTNLHHRVVFFIILHIAVCWGQFPIVLTTWKFESATDEAWKTIQQKSAVDAIEAGCSRCEVQQCDTTVGYGGSPDENGETTLEAMIMDGNTMNVGAVASMRRIKNAASVARLVLDHTSHSILAGDLATQFAVGMGFKEESLSTNKSKQMWKNWTKNSCQPNFWQNVHPDPKKSCGPYKSFQKSSKAPHSSRDAFKINSKNHDTIGMIAIDKSKSIAAGTSTNGAKYKIPGRVGDSPIPGAGAYADSSVGAAAATGDGDVMLRFLPSFLAVEEMRRGTDPSLSAQIAIKRITEHYPSFVGGLITVDKEGNYGAACHGMESFPFSVASPKTNDVRVENVTCLQPQISVNLV